MVTYSRGWNLLLKIYKNSCTISNYSWQMLRTDSFLIILCMWFELPKGSNLYIGACDSMHPVYIIFVSRAWKFLPYSCKLHVSIHEFCWIVHKRTSTSEPTFEISIRHLSPYETQVLYSAIDWQQNFIKWFITIDTPKCKTQ